MGFPSCDNDAHNQKIANEISDFVQLIFKERDSKNKMVERWYYVHKKAHDNIFLVMRKNFDQHFWNTCSYNGLSGNLGRIPLLLKFQDYYHDKEELASYLPIKGAG